MAFTAPTISHSFQNADTTPASGQIQFTLGGRMQNGTTSLVPASISANLNSSGVLSQAISSNIDPGTTPAAPQNVTWRVDIRILGSSVETYYITVPPIQSETNGSILIADLDSVNLSSLTAAAYMVGQSITGVGIPSNTTIISVQAATNSVTISANASAGTGLALTIGSTIDLGQLLPNTQQT